MVSTYIRIYLYIHFFVYMQAHTILGVGDFAANTPVEMAGQLADPVASPNDPAFIIHHTMTDCIFDEWLKSHPDEEYPDVPLTFSTRGHQAHSYIIPFFPLYTNADMFKPAANNFGYFCNLPNVITESVDSGGYPKTKFTVFTWLIVIFIFLVMLY